jgi:chorismate-pyruvate lyase
MGPAHGRERAGILEIGESRYLCREVLLFGRVERLVVAQVSRSASSVFADMALSFPSGSSLWTC